MPNPRDGNSNTRSDPVPEKDGTQPPERLMTVMDVAHYLGISRDSVFALLRTGELKSVLIRKRGRRITREQLDQYLADLQRQH